MSVGAPTGFRTLLGHRTFGRLFLAGVASSAGNSIAGVCLTWLVFQSTGSALAVAYYGASFLLGAASFSLVGGTLVDRYDRRRLMIAADLGRSALVGSLAAALLLWRFELLLVLPVAFLIAAFSVLFEPAERAILPLAIPTVLIGEANALVGSARSTLAFVGVGLGGIILAVWGAPVGIGLNAVTFLISAFLITGVRVASVGPPGAAPPGGGSWRQELTEGFRYLRREVGLLQLTLSATFFNFFEAIVGTFLVVYVALVLHGTPLVFALVLGAGALGTVLGPFLSARVGAARRAGRAWVVAYGVGGGLCALVLALVPVLPVVVVDAFTLGVFSSFGGSAWLTAAQRFVPSEMQGRYFGIDNLGSIAIVPVAQLGGGALIVLSGVSQTYLVAGVGWLLVALAFLLPRSLRAWGDGTLPRDRRAPGSEG